MALKSLFGSKIRPADKPAVDVRAGIVKDRSLHSQGLASKKGASKLVKLKGKGKIQTKRIIAK